MRSETYRGHNVGLLRELQTPSGVGICQHEETGDVSAVCGTCHHLLHSDHSGAWFCSDPACGRRYYTIGPVTSSVFRGYEFNDSMNYSRNFENWVSQWTGFAVHALSIDIAWD